MTAAEGRALFEWIHPPVSDRIDKLRDLERTALGRDEWERLDELVLWLEAQKDDEAEEALEKVKDWLERAGHARRWRDTRVAELSEDPDRAYDEAVDDGRA